MISKKTRVSIQMFLIGFIFLIPQFIYSQQKIGDWTDHLSFQNCTDVNVTSKFIIGVSNSGFFRIDKETYSIEKFTKVNGLSDIDISSFYVINDTKYIIGYQNGNIDIFDNSKITNIADLKNSNISGGKTIYNITSYGSKAYLATFFGIIVLDLNKLEISDTYLIGDLGGNLTINDITIFNDTIYCATAQGLKTAPISSNALSFYDTWELKSPDTKNINSILSFNNQLVAVRSISASSSEFLSIKNNVWTNLDTISNFKKIKTNTSQLILTTSSSIKIYNQDLQLVRTKTKYNFTPQISPSFTSAYKIENEDLCISDAASGLVISPLNGTDRIAIPNGPYTNYCRNLLMTKNYLYVSPGRLDNTWNNTGTVSHVSIYNNNNWQAATINNTPLFNNTRDIITAIADSKIPDRVYFASYGNGIFEMDTLKVKKQYNYTNSGIQNINGWWNYNRVGGGACDKDGNLFLSNSMVKNGIVVKPKDAKDSVDWIQYNYESTSFVTTLGDMLIDRNNYKWLIIPRASLAGLFVFDTNNTLKNQADDRYRGPINPALESDKRNKGQLKLWDEDGEEITTKIFSIAEDKLGYLWIGTDKSVLVYYRPWAVFDDPKPIFNKIKIPRNDGTKYADILLDNQSITAIAVDAANRKWLGTESSGTFLVSEDGTKTIEHFNVDNSPLISNSISSIAIQPKTGVVYIGTDKGIVSYKGTAVDPEKTFQQINIYPNPVKENYNGPITITGLVNDTDIKIASLSGKIVWESQSLGGQAIWNGKNTDGQNVASGVYLVFANSKDGSDVQVGKILIIKSK